MKKIALMFALFFVVALIFPANAPAPCGNGIVQPEYDEECDPPGSPADECGGEVCLAGCICPETPPPGKCWLTAGGVKFEPVVGMRMAQHTNGNGNGPKDSVGGNVYPSCDPDPGDGGNWNHVFHNLKAHLKGTDITVTRCGGSPTGSPECPFNLIEFEGTGTLVEGTGNNKVESPVTFFAQAVDNNEPGNENASKENAGAGIDTYFLQVFDADGLVLEVSNAAGDPITITGGNFQIHCSSCDN